MTYKEIQRKAKELGLPYIGVTKDELLKSIEGTQEPKAGSGLSNPPTDNPPVTTPPVKNEVKSKQGEKKNTAVVYDGNREVRRYSLDVHGSKFADLALSFISDRKYTVEFINVQASHICSACGHRDFE